MITDSKSRAPKARTMKNARLNPVTNMKKLYAVSLETVWALIVSWSAGLAGPSPLALTR